MLRGSKGWQSACRFQISWDSCGKEGRKIIQECIIIKHYDSRDATYFSLSSIQFFFYPSKSQKRRGFCGGDGGGGIPSIRGALRVAGNYHYSLPSTLKGDNNCYLVEIREVFAIQNRSTHNSNTISHAHFHYRTPHSGGLNQAGQTIFEIKPNIRPPKGHKSL